MRQLLGGAVMFAAFVMGYVLVVGWHPERREYTVSRRSALGVGLGLLLAGVAAVAFGTLTQ